MQLLTKGDKIASGIFAGAIISFIRRNFISVDKWALICSVNEALLIDAIKKSASGEYYFLIDKMAHPASLLNYIPILSQEKNPLLKFNLNSILKERVYELHLYKN